MIVIGLTGSIGMGKTTTANLFRAEGVPVFDADAAVHALYAPGGKAVRAVTALIPTSLGENGGVDRAALKAALAKDPALFSKLEAVVHPLVAAARRPFLQGAERKEHAAAVRDVPLLIETGGHRRVDLLVVVSAPSHVQRERVLARPGMTESAFQDILARQTPDAEKRRLADVVIDTSRGVSHAARAVRRVVARVARMDRYRRRWRD